MPMSNALRNDVLEMILQGEDPTWRAGATIYAALVKDVGGGGSVSLASPMANECAYTGYARVAITKSSGFTDGGSTFTNAGQIQWGKRTDAGATETATAVVLVDTASGPVNMALICDMSTDLAISQNITPIVATADLSISAT